MTTSHLPFLKRWPGTISIPLLGDIRLSWIVSGAIALLVIGAAGVGVWEYTNSNAFCGTRCHTMPPEYVAFTNSLHARVNCVECHIGRVNFFQQVWLKSGHGGHLLSLITDSYERPIHLKTLRPARETCERCHWPQAVYQDRVEDIRHYAPDEKNTPSTTFMIMHTGGGTDSEGNGKGIHWHIENKVQYIALDKDKQDIPWVRVIHSDGTGTDYIDVTEQLPPDLLSGAYPVQTMDCLDCHNRTAHLFRSPDQSLDEALQNGQIDSSLPYIKEKGLELLTPAYASADEANAAIAKLPDFYRTQYPEVYQNKQNEILQATAVISRIFEETTFPNMSVGWSTYPDLQGHKDSAGCFRCHDGKHLNEQGQAIRLQCNLCHSIPVVLHTDETAKADELGKQRLPAAEPASHQAPSFMADHRFQANESCQECHGQVTFGADDTSFCSNSACHGQKWPEVQLDAGQQHPIPLEGAHARAWCYQCHNGVRNPAYICANCHQAPHGPGHEQCDQCHTTENWIPFAGGVTDRMDAACAKCHGEGKAPQASM